MRDTAPMVSVIMPAFNSEKFIETAIRSVINQTFIDWELLVIDDGSVDSTCAIVERLAAEDERINLIRNEMNVGVARTRNRGFELCRGAYVALLDSDDVWHPEKLERQVFVAERTGVDIVYCSYRMLDDRGNKIYDDFSVPVTTDFESSLTKSVISCSTAFLRREVVDKYRFVTEFYHEDLVLWLQILRDGHTACGIVDVLADYRVREGARASNKIQSAIHRWKIYRKYLCLPISKSLMLLSKYAFLGIRKYKKCRMS